MEGDFDGVLSRRLKPFQISLGSKGTVKICYVMCTYHVEVNSNFDIEL